ncbi:MAG: hypothetical protein IJE43_14960 [Alphaproteobacteria bacterium]|nr:hypothetical protein [Alphaproteobacteria bacterium]
MRLWHQNLIHKLPQQQLCGQWRECAALLGNGWGRKHAVVNYVFNHSESFLVAYSILIFNEMRQREYNPNPKMMRTQLSKRYNEEEVNRFIVLGKDISQRGLMIYKEHNDDYLAECLLNLENKGIKI